MGSTESMLEGKRVSKLWVGARDAVFFFIFQCKLYFAISLLFFKFLINCFDCTACGILFP